MINHYPFIAGGSPDYSQSPNENLSFICNCVKLLLLIFMGVGIADNGNPERLCLLFLMGVLVGLVLVLILERLLFLLAFVGVGVGLALIVMLDRLLFRVVEQVGLRSGLVMMLLGAMCERLGLLA